MPDIFVPIKRDVLKAVGLAAVAVTGLVAVRYMGVRNINSAERLADALLNTDALRNAAGKLPDVTASVLGTCAIYAVNVAFRAAEGVGTLGSGEDPVGEVRTATHPYTGASVTVLTESNSPDHLLTYSVTIPDVGQVSGTRRIGATKVASVPPARPEADTIQITLKEDYVALIETEFQIAEYVFTGKTRLYGALNLRDNQGNAGRLNIGYDGNVSGTVTREAKVVGRFEGQVAHGIRFTQYQIEGGSPAR
jgi:hypothetical protein